MKVSRKQREVLEALADGAVLWKGITGCHVAVSGDVDWATFDHMV